MSPLLPLLPPCAVSHSPAAHRSSSFFPAASSLLVCLANRRFHGRAGVPTVVLVSMSLRIVSGEHLFRGFSAVCLCVFGDMSVHVLSHFLNRVVFLMLVCEDSGCILGINSALTSCVCSRQSVGCRFTPSRVFFAQKVLVEAWLTRSATCCLCSWCYSREIVA